MAEVLGVIVSAFTVVEIAGKLGSSTIKLKKLWDEVQEVPSEMKQLVGMVDILNATLTELNRAFDKAGDPNFGTLDICSNRSPRLRNFRRRMTNLKVTFKKDLIQSCEKKVQTALQILSLSLSTRIYIGMNTKPQPYSVQADTSGSDLPPIETSTCQHVRLVEGPIIGSKAAINVARTSRTKPVLQTQASFFGSFASQSIPHSEFPEVQIYQAQLQLPWWMSARIWNIQVYNAYAGWQHSLRAWTIRPDNTPIFKHIETSDWEHALCEIKEVRASLFDRDEDGQTLLYILLEDIQHEKDLQPEDFCATIEKSQNGSLGLVARSYRFNIEDDDLDHWRGLARWIFKGVSLERLSMQNSLHDREDIYTFFFTGCFGGPWSYVNLGRRIHKFLRMWLEDVQTSGIDLDEYGQREMEIFKRDALLQEQRLEMGSTNNSGHFGDIMVFLEAGCVAISSQET
ncbi:hypothetical protein CSAL01_10532 [Colletotrichum salicis]|uniref:Fungal N-terminal domain-containing protein n=1 Tax=Colletotrichum salicis TaxID=1209931 RepID=A0A135VAN0_9PEZI|nr:hypothetical protein CSAL01_10532 [Colletotrichum salicis]